MLAPALHPFRRYRPSMALDFIPSCAEHFAATCGRQNRELKCPRGRTFLTTKFGHEVADLVVWQRSKVLDTFYLGARRKQLIEMAAPSCGIVAIAKVVHLGPRQHGLDTSANTARRLW